MSQRFDEKNEDIRFSSKIVDLSDDGDLARMVEGKHGSEKYKAISKYILDKIGSEAVFQGGVRAILDNADRNRIAHMAGNKKTAEVSAVDRLIGSAYPFAYDSEPEHNKFNLFLYYRADATYKGEPLSVYFNIGRGKNDSPLHLYDITNRIKDTADRINGLERLREFLSKNGILNMVNVVSYGDAIVKSEESINESNIRYSKAPEGYNPKKTIEVFKLMRLQGKKLYPLFIDNASPIDLNTWYLADSPNLSILKKMPTGTFLVDYKNQTYKSIEEYGKENDIKVGKKPTVQMIYEAARNGLRWIRIEETERAQARFGGENRKYRKPSICFC